MEGHAMGLSQKQIEEARSSERIALQCSIVLASGMQVGEGTILNLSGRGCLVESSVSVKAGDYLQLRFSFDESEPSMRVSRAAVCWAEGPRFGVEFIGMEEKDRTRLNRFLTLQGGDPWARRYD
jgi:PilZ domain